MNNLNKVIIIGYSTYNNSGVFPGGTEVVTDALIKYFMNKNSHIRYYVTRKLTNDMKMSYEFTYNCEVMKKSEISLESIEDYNPDLVVVSVCSFDTYDITYNIVSKISKCPVLIYSHGANCCSINNYSKEVLLGNFYFTYLDNNSFNHHIKFGIPENHNFKVINSIFIDNPEIKEVPDYKYDVFSNARIVPQKGIYNVAKLCKSLNFNLGMIGKAQSNNRELSWIRDELGDLLDYKGLVNRSEMVNLVQSSKFIGFLPNAQEGGSPLTVLESMALGTPVITWDDFEISSVVNPELNIVLDHTDKYIDQFIEEYYPKIDQYLSINNRKILSEFVINNFGIKAYYDRLDQIIKQI